MDSREEGDPVEPDLGSNVKATKSTKEGSNSGVVINQTRTETSFGSSSLSSTSSGSDGRQTARSFVANTSTSSDSVIEPSPGAYNVDVVIIPPSQDEEMDVVDICTPSEKIASLQLSGQKSPNGADNVSPDHDYEPEVIRISSPSQTFDSDHEPMEMAETEPYFSTDAFEIPQWQQVLNEEQLTKEYTQSSESRSKSESSEDVEVEQAVTQSSAHFQAWQTSAGSSYPEGTRSRSISAGKAAVPACGNKLRKEEELKKPREISSEPSKMFTEKHTERTRSTSAPPKKIKSTSSTHQTEKPANTKKNLITKTNDEASLRLHLTETVQDSSLGELQPGLSLAEPQTGLSLAESQTGLSLEKPQTGLSLANPQSSLSLAEPMSISKTCKESVQAKAGAEDAEEMDGEEDLFDESNDDQIKPEEERGVIDDAEAHGGTVDCDVLSTSQDWHLHLTQTQSDTQAARSQGRQVVGNKQGTGIEVEKPQDVSTSSRSATGLDLSPVEQYESNSFVKNTNITQSPRERSGTGFHFSLPKDDSLKPVSDVITGVGYIMKKGPQHHSTPILEKEESKTLAENVNVPETQEVEAINEPPTTSVPVLIPETDPNSESTPIFHVSRPPDSGELIIAAKESPTKTPSIFSKVQQAREADENLDVNDQSSSSGHCKNQDELPFNDSSVSVSSVNISEDTEIIQEEGDTNKNIADDLNNVRDEHSTLIVKKLTRIKQKKAASATRRQSPRKQRSLERRDPFEFSDSQSYGTRIQTKRQGDPSGESSASIKRRKLSAGRSPKTSSAKKDVGNPSKRVSVSLITKGRGSVAKKTPLRGNKSQTKSRRGSLFEQQVVNTRTIVEKEKVGTQGTTVTEHNQPSTSTNQVPVEYPIDKSDPKKVTWSTQITTTTTTIVRFIREQVVRDGVLIDVKERTEVDVPIVKITEQHDNNPVSPSRTTSSFTSGDLGDVSSLSTSKSSSGSGNSFMRSISSGSLPRSSSNLVAAVDVSPRVSTTTSDSSEKGAGAVTSKQLSSGLNGKRHNQEEPFQERSHNGVRGLTDRSSKKVAFTEPSTLVTRSRRLSRHVSGDVDDTGNTSLASLRAKKQMVSKNQEEEDNSWASKHVENPSMTSLKAKKQLVSNKNKETEQVQEEGMTDSSGSPKSLENTTLKAKEQLMSNGSKNADNGRGGDTSSSSKDLENVLTTGGIGTPDGTKPGTDVGESRPQLVQEVVCIDAVKTASKQQQPRRRSPRKAEARCQPSPRNAKTVQSTSESSGDLTEPPDPEIGPYLLPGVRVLARWRDGYYYPGSIAKEDTPKRYLFCFDDGDMRVVALNDILHKSWLPKGQLVLAESNNEFYSLGKVIGYFRDDDESCGYIVENVNSGESQRYPRSKIILTKEQATPLLQFSANTYLNTGLNLDNIVSGKRLRGSSGVSGGEKPQTTKKVVEQKVRSPASTPSRKRLGAPMKDHTVSVIEKPYTPTVKRRKTRLDEEESASSLPVHASTFMGPLPQNKSLFKGLNFLITHGEVVKSATSSSGSSAGTDDEMHMRFNRDYAYKQITQGGGAVLKSYDSSQKCSGKLYLIANTHCRTKKYFQALAAGLPCISHQWLRHSCTENKLQDITSYVLHTGESMEEGKLIECSKEISVLRGMHIMVVSEQEETKSTWISILHAARCDVVSNLPSNPIDSNVAFTCDVIVTDPTCPKSIRDKAVELGIPVVSTEWVIQCLINGYKPHYQGHVSYTWNYRKKR